VPVEPRIAAVIPAYNAAAIVAAAVESLRRQTIPPAEIIVVDDGSRDDTSAVAARAGARVIRQENGGPAAARNRGIAATNAEWIALLDADDISYPTRIERQRHWIEETQTAVISARSFIAGVPGVTVPRAADFASLWRRNTIRTSTVLLRRRAWEEVGGFDESRALIGVEDYNLWLRLAHAGWTFRLLDEELAEYRPTEASLTFQTPRFAAAELANVARLAEQLALSPEMIDRKEFELYRSYGLELFHFRHFALARRYLREAARRGPIGWDARLRLWATILPSRPRVGSLHRSDPSR